MPKPSKNKILKKVLSHLHKDVKDQNEGAKEDKQLSKVIRNKKDKKLKGPVAVPQKGMVPDVKKCSKKKKKKK